MVDSCQSHLPYGSKGSREKVKEKELSIFRSTCKLFVQLFEPQNVEQGILNRRSASKFDILRFDILRFALSISPIDASMCQTEPGDLPTD